MRPMKFLPGIMLIPVVISIVFICRNQYNQTAVGNYALEDTIVNVVEVQDNKIDSDLSEKDTTDKDWSLITKYDNIKVRWGMELPERNLSDDMDHKECTALFRYINDDSSDSTIIVGPFNTVLGSGKLCKIIIGVDTVSVNITRKLPRKIDVRRAGMLKGCKHYRLSKHYALSDSAWTTDFQLNISLQDSTPKFIGQFISAIIRNDMTDMFDFCESDGFKAPLLKEFAYNGNIYSMMNYYYRYFRIQYKKKFGEPLSEDDIKNGCWNTGERFSYQLYVYPVWENLDKSLTTWKFYIYTYRGGLHGNECEYYLTFDNVSHRLLGIKDFYKKKKIHCIYEILRIQLNKYLQRDSCAWGSCTAYLNSNLEVKSIYNKILKERFNGEIYPRPAITSHGIIFSYQPYEKGSYSEGILHFIQPYKDDFKIKR